MIYLNYKHEKNCFYDVHGVLYRTPQYLLDKASEIFVEVESRIQDLTFLVELESDPNLGVNNFYLRFSENDYYIYHIRLKVPEGDDIAWFDYMLHDVASEFGRAKYLKNK